MKKLFIYLAMAAAATALLVSCNDKGKDEEKTLAQAAAGNYSINCSLIIPPATTPTDLNATLSITALTENTVKIELKDLVVVVPIPVEISSATVTGTNSNIAVDYEGNILVGNNPVEGGSVKGTIKPGSASVINLSVGIAIPSVGDLTITVTDKAK